MNEFSVKVYRYHNDDLGETYDGFYISKVYSVRNNEFLVYDDGCNSAVDFAPHFEWVCFEYFYEDICSKTYHSIVELV